MITTNAKQLRAAIIDAAQHQKKAPVGMSCLRFVRIDGETVHVTDLEQYNAAAITTNGNGDAPHYAPIADLKKILAAIGDADVVIDTLPPEGRRGHAVTISSRRGAFTLPSIDPAEYPERPASPTPDVVYNVDADTLAGMLRRVLPASGDESRPVLSGVLLEVHPEDGFAVVATDSYRLHAAEHGTPPRGDGLRVLLPGNAARAILAHLPAGGQFSLRADAKRAEYTVGDWSGSCRLIEGTFPNWRSLFPDAGAAEITAALPAAVTLDALKMSGMLGRGNEPVRLTLRRTSPAELRRTLPESEFMVAIDTAAEFPPGYPDAEIEIGFNADFLADAITCAADEVPLLNIIAPLRPAWITSTAGDVTYRGLLMPIRLS